MHKLLNRRQIEVLEHIRRIKEKGQYSFHKAVDLKSGPAILLDGTTYKMLSSYDYLGLIGNSEIEESAIEAIRRYGTGSGGVRLLSGTNKLHLELEHKLSTFKGTEAALTFSSGYNANLAVISTLLDAKDLVIVDSKIHQSTIDACKLAGVPYRRFAHNDAGSLKHILSLSEHHPRILIVSEGVFSMDGDICDLRSLVDAKNEFGAFLMIDESHSLGVLGKNGKGVDSHLGVPTNKIDLFVGSLSKAIPSNGGFAAGSLDLITLLQHNSSPYIFSAAIGPASAAAAVSSLEMMNNEEERLHKLWNNTRFFIQGLKKLGYNTGLSESPIVPVIMKSEEETLDLAKRLFENKILATPVLFPAVPKKEPRLRLCVTAAQDQKFLEEVLEVFAKMLQLN